MNLPFLLLVLVGLGYLLPHRFHVLNSLLISERLAVVSKIPVALRLFLVTSTALIAAFHFDLVINFNFKF